MGFSPQSLHLAYSKNLVAAKPFSCLPFTLFIRWIELRKNVPYLTIILYRLSCLLSSCPYFSPPVVNDLLYEVVIERRRAPVIPTLTRLNKVVCINSIHSKEWIINFYTPILGLNLPLQLEIILPCTVALINLRIYGIISFSHPWLIDLKLNTNWICIGISSTYLSLPLEWVRPG